MGEGREFLLAREKRPVGLKLCQRINVRMLPGVHEVITYVWRFACIEESA